jgi:hypothetical protein
MVSEARSTQLSARNVLEDLDSRIPTTKGLSVEQAVKVFEKAAEASKAPS